MSKTVGVNYSIGASLTRTVGSSFGSLSSRVRGLKGELGSLGKQTRTATSLLEAQNRTQEMRARYLANRNAENLVAYRTAATALGKAKTAAAQYGIGVQNATKAQEALTRRIDSTKAALSRQEQMMANQAKRRDIHGQILGTAATAMAFAVPVKLAIDYESSFAELKKGMSFTDAAQESRVQQDIFDLSRTFGIDAVSMTKIASAGSSVNNDASGNLDADMLRQFMEEAAKMSIAYGISTDDAAARVADLKNNMGLTLEQIRGMSDAISHLSANTTANAGATLNVVSRLGSLAQASGIGEKSLTGLAAAFVSVTKDEGAATSAMKAFLSRMATVDSMSKSQQEAFRSIGIRNVKALSEGLRKGGQDAENVILDIFTALQNAPEAARASIASELFGQNSMTMLAPLLNDPAKLAEAFSIANSQNAVGALMDNVKKSTETTRGALDRLKTTSGVLGITIGSVLLPPIATSAEVMTAVLTRATGLMERFPLVTKVVMMTGLALVGLKIGAMGAVYAATILSDGWMIAKGILNFFRPSVIATNVALLRQRGAALAAAAGTRLMVVKTKLAALGQWKLNAALVANPVGIAVVAVAALAAGMVYLYNTFEPVRAAVDNVFGFVGEKVDWALGKLRTVGQWLGLVDKADEAADKAASKQTAAPPTSTALPPMTAVTPEEWMPTGTDPDSMTAALAALGSGVGQSGGRSPSMPQAAPGGAMNYQLDFNLHGISDGDFAKRVFDGLNRRKGELESIIADIVSEQRRLAYGG